MKKIFILLLVGLYAYQAQAQSKQCVSVALVGSNIEISIKETNNVPFVIGTSDVRINTGGLGYYLLPPNDPLNPPTLPFVVTNVSGTSLSSAYIVDVIERVPGSLALSIINNGGGAKTIGTSSELLVSIPVTGVGTPSLIRTNIFKLTTEIVTGDCSAIILPLELLSFNANKDGEKALIQWESTKERDLSFYAIERSSDGKNFKTINYEKPKAKTPDEKAAYSILDEKPELGINYYRLLMKDTDGKETYSKVASVDFGSKIKAKTYPNPFSSDLSIEIDIEKNIKGDVVIDVLDMTGKIVQTKKLVAEGRRISFNLPTDDLVPGSYVIRMQNGTNTWQQKITKQ